MAIFAVSRGDFPFSSARLVWLSALLGLAMGCVPPAMASSATTYVYKGNTFTYFLGDVSCPPECSIHGSFTVSDQLPPNSNLFETPTAFDFYISPAASPSLTKANTTNPIFNIETDASGGIKGWNIELFTGSISSSSTEFVSCYMKGACAIDAYINSPDGIFGPANVAESNAPGTWTITPEPSPGILLGVGLISLFGLIWETRLTSRGSRTAG